MRQQNHGVQDCRSKACLSTLLHTLLAEHLVVTAGALKMRGGYGKLAALDLAFD